MGESAREYTARFVYNACAGMLEFVHLLLISKVLFNLNTDDGMWFTYAAVFAPLPAFIVAGMRKSNIVWLLEYVVKAKTSVREVESVDKATVNVPYNEKLVLGALDIIGRGFILRILRTFGPAMAGIIWVTSITLVPTYTQIRYGAAGSPPKRTTIIGMALCTFAVLMLAFMKPLYSEEGYWNVDIEGVQALAEKQAAFYAFIVCGGVNVLKLIATARVNKSVTDEARQLTPTEVLMSSSDASAALLIPAFLLDLTWKNGFLWIKAPFQKPVRYVIAESFPDYDRSFTTENVEVFCQAFAALGLATALKAVTETKTVKKNLPWQPIEVLFYFVAIMAYNFYILVHDATLGRKKWLDLTYGMDTKNFSGLKGDWGFYALVPALFGLCLLLSGMPDIQELELGKTASKDRDKMETDLQSDD